MTMSDEEICREYRLAKRPYEQVTIIADMNQCNKEKIMRTLIRNGADMSNAVYHRNKKARDFLVKLLMEELDAADEEVRKAVHHYEMVLKSIESIGGKKK